MNVGSSYKRDVQVVADIICPWCFIAKRSLDRALPSLESQGLVISVQWLPFQLNPLMPPEGMDRREFRTSRFGLEESLQMDERAVRAGRSIGAHFDYSGQTRTPNTVPAQALAMLAWQEGGSSLQADVIDALFVSYFARAQDISAFKILTQIADQAGLVAGAVERSQNLHEQVRAVDSDNRAQGIAGVPTYLENGKFLFSGSQSIERYLTIFSP